MGLKGAIVADSCCDLWDINTNDDIEFYSIPLPISVGSETFMDDEKLDVAKLVQTMNACAERSATACPSPDRFAEVFIKHDITFVVTLSSKLSGTFNSAMLARQLVLETHPDKQIHVINSNSASAGEVNITLKLLELMEADGATFEGVADEIEKHKRSVATYFVLQRFDNMIKTGRMGRFAGFIAQTLLICPICGDDGDGMIKVYEKVRTPLRALRRMVEMLGDRVNPEGRTLAICHCDNLSAAEFIKEQALKLYALKDVIIRPMRGVAAFYANHLGIVAAI